MPEEEKKKAANPSAVAAALGVAAAVTPSDPAPDPFKEMRAIQENLQSQVDARTKDALRLSMRNQDLAADRDRWRDRAQKAEPLVDGLALERVTKDRDGLKKEVSLLQKKLNDLQLDLEGTQASETGFERRMLEIGRENILLKQTMETMQAARDAAQAARDKAFMDLAKAVKRVAELEGEIKDLIAPRAALPPMYAKDQPTMIGGQGGTAVNAVLGGEEAIK